MMTGCIEALRYLSLHFANETKMVEAVNLTAEMEFPSRSSSKVI